MHHVSTSVLAASPNKGFGARTASLTGRFNECEDNDSGRFVKALRGTDGRRVTYAALTNSHSLWRLKPGRAARSTAQSSISGRTRGRRTENVVNSLFCDLIGFV
jgi:hypothetical protein